MGRYMQTSPFFSRFLGLFAGPRNVRTNSVYGYMMFYLMAKLRHTRRSSLIYEIEQKHIENWLAAISSTASVDYDSAIELARCGRLIKGYSATRERGNENLQKILELLSRMPTPKAESVEQMRNAALADDVGRALAQIEMLSMHESTLVAR